MAKLTDHQKACRKASRTRVYSTEKTQFPEGFIEAVEMFARVNPQRVIAFDFKVWMKTRPAPTEENE